LTGLVGWQKGWRIQLQRKKIAGVSFLQLTLPQRRAGFLEKKAAQNGAKKLYRCGVRKAIFPREFPYEEVFLRQGICLVDPAPLYRAMAAPIARFLREDDIGRVVLCARSVTTELELAAEELSREIRHIGICCERRGEELAQGLRRRCGVAIRRDILPESLCSEDLLLLFEKIPLPKTKAQIVPLWGGKMAVDFALSPELKCLNMPSAQLLAALYTAGAVKREKIQLLSISLPQKGETPEIRSVF